jgi:sugar phosphate isomerase/epimerase
VEGCLRHGIGGICPWRDKIAAAGLAEADRLIRQAGLRVSGVCRGGMVPAADAEGRRRALAENRRAVDEAATLGADCLVMVVGGLPPGSKDIAGARRQVEDGLAATLDYARTVHVPIAIEPLHPMYAADRACVNTLGQALDLCEKLGAGVGVAIDAYHVWWDPDLDAQIARAGRGGRILAWHVCDWLVPTRDILNDRGMMGDGIIELRRLRASVEAAGFDGLVEVEIFSAATWWPKPLDEILATMVGRGRTVV